MLADYDQDEHEASHPAPRVKAAVAAATVPKQKGTKLNKSVARKHTPTPLEIAKAIRDLSEAQAAADIRDEGNDFYPIFHDQEDVVAPGNRVFVAAASGPHPHEGARLGEAFKLTENMISKHGLTRAQSLATPDAANYEKAMDAEKIKMNTPGLHHKLKAFTPVLFDKRTMRPLSMRHVNTKKTRITGPSFDSRLCIRGFAQRDGTYPADRISSSVCSQDAVKMSMAMHATTPGSKLGVVDGTRAFLQSPLCE